MIEYDFEKIALLRNERRTLKRLKKTGSCFPSEIPNFHSLYNADLLEHDKSDEVDQFGARTPLETVHVTEKYLRYHSWRMNKILCSVLLPIVISAATTVVLYTLEHWLLPTVLQLISSLVS